MWVLILPHDSDSPVRAYDLLIAMESTFDLVDEFLGGILRALKQPFGLACGLICFTLPMELVIIREIADCLLDLACCLIFVHGHGLFLH